MVCVFERKGKCLLHRERVCVLDGYLCFVRFQHVGPLKAIPPKIPGTFSWEKDGVGVTQVGCVLFHVQIATKCKARLWLGY